MQTTKEKGRMTIPEIRELLELRDWVYRELADEMGVHINTVQRWLDGDRVPTGPASKLMRRLLAEARAEKKLEAVS